MWKGTWHHKTLEKHGEIKKIKIHMWSAWLLIKFMNLLFTTEDMKKEKVQVLWWNEMLSLYCSAFGFVSESEEYNPE